MPTKEKINEVAALKELMTKSCNIIIADHTGINVEEMTALRRELKKSNAELRIAKNTLLKIAAKESGLEVINEYLAGPTSLIFGYDDPSAPARKVNDLQKKTERPKVKGYILDNRLLGLEDYKKIAQLPPKEVVLAQLVGSLDWPIVEFVMTLDAITKNLIGVVDAVAEQKKEQAES
jgi:large subunit ribosomal protein L10